MNLIQKRSRRSPGILFLLFLLALRSSAPGGILLTKAMEASIGSITDRGDAIELKNDMGWMLILKDQILWYEGDAVVDTFWEAYTAAEKKGQPMSVLLRLLKLSIQQESATREKAVASQKNIQSKLDEQLAIQLAESKIKEVPKVIDTPRWEVTKEPVIAVDVSLRQTEFEGFIPYQTQAFINGQMITFTTLHPIFSNRQIDTQVSVGGGTSVMVRGGGSRVNVKGR